MQNTIDQYIDVLLSEQDNDTMDRVVNLVANSKRVPVMIANAVGPLWNQLPLQDIGLIVSLIYLAGRAAGQAELLNSMEDN